MYMHHLYERSDQRIILNIYKYRMHDTDYFGSWITLLWAGEMDKEMEALCLEFCAWEGFWFCSLAVLDNLIFSFLCLALQNMCLVLFWGLLALKISCRVKLGNLIDAIPCVIVYGVLRLDKMGMQ